MINTQSFPSIITSIPNGCTVTFALMSEEWQSKNEVCREEQWRIQWFYYKIWYANGFAPLTLYYNQAKYCCWDCFQHRFKIFELCAASNFRQQCSAWLLFHFSHLKSSAKELYGYMYIPFAYNWLLKLFQEAFFNLSLWHFFYPYCFGFVCVALRPPWAVFQQAYLSYCGSQILHAHADTVLTLSFGKSLQK